MRRARNAILRKTSTAANPESLLEIGLNFVSLLKQVREFQHRAFLPNQHPKEFFDFECSRWLCRALLQQACLPLSKLAASRAKLVNWIALMKCSG